MDGHNDGPAMGLRGAGSARVRPLARHDDDRLRRIDLLLPRRKRWINNEHDNDNDNDNDHDYNDNVDLRDNSIDLGRSDHEHERDRYRDDAWTRPAERHRSRPGHHARCPWGQLVKDLLQRNPAG
jgi:hypothetical protein